MRIDLQFEKFIYFYLNEKDNFNCENGNCPTYCRFIKVYPDCPKNESGIIKSIDESVLIRFVDKLNKGPEKITIHVLDNSIDLIYGENVKKFYYSTYATEYKTLYACCNFVFKKYEKIAGKK